MNCCEISRLGNGSAPKNWRKCICSGGEGGALKQRATRWTFSLNHRFHRFLPYLCCGETLFDHERFLAVLSDKHCDHHYGTLDDHLGILVNSHEIESIV